MLENSDLNISESLKSFESITLPEMNAVSLMERTDTKYVLNRNTVMELLPELSHHYRVLEVNGMRLSPYETLYFDTKEFGLYLLHHNSKLSRFKIRFRRYASTGAVFFEIKHRNIKGKTIKKRIEQDVIPGNITASAGAFLVQHTQHVPEDFESKLWVNYSRITLVNKSMTERVTLDLGLSYKNGGDVSLLEDIVIAEVKGEKRHASVFNTRMKERHIRSGSISKYCIGIAKMFDGIKSNSFKRQLLLLNKHADDTITIN